MLNIPDLNKFKVFHAVYEMRSLVRAAESLHVTRSAVSQALKNLEDELRTKLFIRDSKNILPTEPAEILFRSLHVLFSDLGSALKQIEIGKQEPVGRLRIGAPQEFGSLHLTEAIVEFHKSNPGVTFEMMLATPVKLLELVSSGQLDLAFVDNGDVHGKNYPVSIKAVMKERFILSCSRKYFETHLKNGVLRYGELGTLGFIDYLPHAPVAKMWIRHHFGKSPYNLSVTFSAESVRSVIKAIQGGFGVGVVPEHMIQKELKSGQLVKISIKDRDMVNQISLVRRLGRTISAREKAFVDFFLNFLPSDLG